VCLFAETLFVFVRDPSFQNPHPDGFITAHTSGEQMKRNILFASLGSVLLVGSMFSSQAQVKQVEMHIDGYLCGN
jgi:hypothetical protein